MGTGRVRRAAVAAALAVLLAGAAAAGCGAGGDDRPRTIPSLDPSWTIPRPSPTGTEGMTDKEQIRAVYLDYNAHFQEAETMGRKERRRFLSQWLVNPALTDHVEGIGQQVRKGQRGHGHGIAHVIGIVVHGRTARLDDCLDESHIVIKDASGKVVKRGHKDVWLTSRATRTSRGWRLARFYTPEKSCHAS